MHLEHQNNSSRRQIIQYLALISGLVMTSSSLELFASNFSKPTDLGRVGNKGLLTHDQLQLLGDIGDVIIPTTDTPGALAANAHVFINQFAITCLDSSQQNQILMILNKITAAADTKFKDNFKQLTVTQKIQLLTDAEQANTPFTPADKTNFKLLKSLVAFAYYTSEIGATQELSYLAIPGGYKGNVKFSHVGKAWALSQ